MLSGAFPVGGLRPRPEFIGTGLGSESCDAGERSGRAVTQIGSGGGRACNDDGAGAQKQYVHQAAAARIHRPVRRGTAPRPERARLRTVRSRPPGGARGHRRPGSGTARPGPDRRGRGGERAPGAARHPRHRQAPARPAPRGPRRLGGARGPPGPAPARLAGARHVRGGRPAPRGHRVRARARRGRRPGLAAGRLPQVSTHPRRPGRVRDDRPRADRRRTGRPRHRHPARRSRRRPDGRPRGRGAVAGSPSSRWASAAGGS